MTKWFDTNYHYIVQIFTRHSFSLNADRLISLIHEAKKNNKNVKPVIIGPVTYLNLGKEKDSSNKLDLLEKILPIYKQLLDRLSAENIEWVQIDEPALVTELDDTWHQAYKTAYETLSKADVKILLTTYFGGLDEKI